MEKKICRLFSNSYWDEDEDEAPSTKAKEEAGSDSEEDPLDAFMAGLSEKMKESEKQSKTGKKADRNDKASKGVRDDIEVEDDEVRKLSKRMR